MIYDFEPGDKVLNPEHKEWGIGELINYKNQNNCKF